MAYFGPGGLAPVCLAALAAVSGFPALSRAQAPSPARQSALVVEAANWQPQSLNDSPSFSTFGKAGATPRFSGGISLSVGGGIGLRLSGGFWSLRDLAREAQEAHSLALHSVTMDLKYWLVPDYRLSAYTLYGASVYWGVENDTQPFGGRLRTARPGWGINFGAGFDLALTRRVAAGMVFRYRFIRFREALAGLNDFSGPEIGVALSWFLVRAGSG